MKKLLLTSLSLFLLSGLVTAQPFTSDYGYFQANYSSSCTPALTNFTILSVPVGTATKDIQFSYSSGYVAWSGPSINHNYTVGDTYDVWVEFRDASGSFLGYDHIRLEIHGQPGPVITEYGVTSACPGDKVRFHVSQGWLPTSGDYTYTWDFGDGSPIETTDYQDMKHAFAAPGTYNITVTTSGTCGGPYVSTGSFTVGTSVPFPSSLQYNIWLNPDEICPNAEVYFGYPEDYISTFVQWGDGQYSTDGNHLHNYTLAGEYYPTVTITNGCGNSYTFMDTLRVITNLPWSSTSTSYGIYNSSPACPGTTVDFQAWINGAVAYEWMDSGLNILSTDNYFETSFSSSTDVYLTVTNGCGYDTTILTVVNISSNIPVDPNDFEPSVPDSICTGAMFNYSGNGMSDDNDGLTFTWDFGDGSPIVTGYSGNHEYTANGTYNLTITAVNSCGMDTTTNLSIVAANGIAPDPSSFFYFVPENAEVCPGDSALFVGLYYMSDATYSIDFGDGDVSSTPNQLNIMGFNYFYFLHTYTSLGIYNTTLTVTNGCGLSAQKNLQVKVGANFPAEMGIFYDEAQSICFGDPIDFYSFGASQFIWDFGDGSGTLVTNNVMTPIPHVYEHPGAYTITVQGTNFCGNSAYDQTNVFVPDNRINITTNTIDAQCNTADGKAIAVISGGSAPYDVTWSNGSNDILVDSLSAGIYVCNVTDNNGCYNFGIATVSDAQAPAIVVNNVIDVTCNGGNDGVIDINVIGSTGPFNFQWSNGATNEDIAGLVAGPYEIFVTDANGCMATASIMVNEPDKVNVSFVVTDASCGDNDGIIEASANGNSAPYTFVWSHDGSTNSTLYNVGLGVYEVNVIDSKGCVVTEVTTVDENNGNGGPAIALNSISDLDCGGTGSTIDISTYITMGTPTYSWSTGATTEDITVTSEGTYTVTVTDGLGCKAIEVYEVEHAAPPTVPICMVSVDSTWAVNEVIWEKPVSTSIDHFNIYRESSQAGLYYHVGTVDYDSLSVYTDYVANPQIQSWRYKISSVDDCGQESQKSDAHKTIHLNQNLGLGGTVNLIWDDYEGFGYSTFNVLRYTQTAGYVNLASIASTNHSYTDIAAPTADSTLFYIITLDLVDPCTATRAQNNNTVRSNRSERAMFPITVQELPQNFSNSHIYPNPATQTLTVEFEVNAPGDYTIAITDALGQQVMTNECGQVDHFYKKDLSIGGLDRGIYFVTIRSEKGGITKRLVKL